MIFCMEPLRWPSGRRIGWAPEFNFRLFLLRAPLARRAASLMGGAWDFVVFDFWKDADNAVKYFPEDSLLQFNYSTHTQALRLSLTQAIARRASSPARLIGVTMASCDGPALLAAAVRAAILAHAPRRTVQAVATAVASVLVRPAMAKAAPATVPAAAASAPRSAAPAFGDASADALLEALRAKRSAHRAAKRERLKARRSASAAPGVSESVNEAPVPAATGSAPETQAATGLATGGVEEAAHSAANSRGAVPVLPDATEADNAARLASLLQQAQASQASTVPAASQLPWPDTGSQLGSRSGSRASSEGAASCWSTQTPQSTRLRLEAECRAVRERGPEDSGG